MPDTQLTSGERIGAVASFVFVIASFLPMVQLSVPLGSGFGSFTGSQSAWHSYALLGVFVGLGGIALWAVDRFQSGRLPDVGTDWNRIGAGLLAFGTLLIVIRTITWSGEGGAGISISIAWGFFVLLISGIVAVLAMAAEPAR